jgi:hypothetical protein
MNNLREPAARSTCFIRRSDSATARLGPVSRKADSIVLATEFAIAFGGAR